MGISREDLYQDLILGTKDHRRLRKKKSTDAVVSRGRGGKGQHYEGGRCEESSPDRESTKKKNGSNSSAVAASGHKGTILHTGLWKGT